MRDWAIECDFRRDTERLMPSGNEEIKDDKLVCLQCGAEVPADEWQCPGCGSDRHLIQRDRVSAGVMPSMRPPRRTRPSVYSGLAIIIIVAVSLILINAAGKPPAEAVSNDEEVMLDIALEAGSGDSTEQDIVKSLTGLEDDDFDTLVGEGAWHASRSEWPEAISAFEKALARKNDETGVMEELARAYIELDDIDNAMFHLDRWIEVEPDDPAPYALKGSIYFGQGKYEEAREAYRDALYRTGAGDSKMDEYSRKLAEIRDIIAEKEQVKEETSEFDIGEGWIHEPMPEYKPGVKPESKPQPEGGTTPFSQFFDNDKGDDDSLVLLGEGQESSTTEPVEADADTEEEEAAEDKPEGSIEITLGEGESSPEHTRITGARYDSSDEDFSLYFDTEGRASPRYYYDKPANVFWITVPNAECDFSNVPIERTFTHPLVESVRSWADDGGNVRFKIILKEPIQYSSPTIMALGFSLRMWSSS